jgi:Tol biopolymer transport system component
MVARRHEDRLFVCRAICVMSRDANVSTLTNQGAVPAWSPDGTRIAFVRLLPLNFEILVMNADGSGVTALSMGIEPHW